MRLKKNSQETKNLSSSEKFSNLQRFKINTKNALNTPNRKPRKNKQKHQKILKMLISSIENLHWRSGILIYP